MNDDIVKKLRDHENFDPETVSLEAADEIERLRLGVAELQARVHWLNEDLLKARR
jgi:hypothetical protein